MELVADAGGALRAGPARLSPDRRRRGRPPAGEGALSLVLHAAAIAALLLTLERQKMSDHGSQASVAVVFEGGPKASTPQTQESRRSTPHSAPDERATEEAPAGALPAAPSAAQPPPAPPAAASATPTAQGAPPAAETPAVAPGVAHLTLPPPSHAARPGSQAARPTPRRAAPTAASPFGALSAPMNLSLAGHPPPPASAGHLARGIFLGMAPTDQNRNVMTRYAEARRRLGEDWWDAFSAFVEAHKYYPMSAAVNGEDGQSVLRLVVERDGTVRSAKIELSSGSPRLDMAWLSEFRGAKVPAFPPGTTENEISFPASMTYILERE